MGRPLYLFLPLRFSPFRGCDSRCDSRYKVVVTVVTVVVTTVVSDIAIQCLTFTCNLYKVDVCAPYPELLTCNIGYEPGLLYRA